MHTLTADQITTLADLVNRDDVVSVSIVELLPELPAERKGARQTWTFAIKPFTAEGSPGWHVMDGIGQIKPSLDEEPA